MRFPNAGFAKLCFAILFFSFLSNNSKAQSTLSKGDIAFTGYYSNGVAPSLNDQFSFVLLTTISNNTVINFTDNGWIRTGPTTGSFRTGEGTVTYTSNGTYNAGTEILITMTSSTTATATLVGGASAGTATGTVMPNFSANGDQVIAYQGTAGSPTFISAIHMNVYSVASIPPDIPGGDAVTTTTTEWDGAENTANASGLPALGGSNFLTNGTDAIWIPGSIIAEKDNARFNGCAVPMGNAAAARAALNNVANWATNNDDPSVGPPAFSALPTGCSYITALPAPSFTTNPTSVSICENANTTFTVAATGATGYQWQVDNGGGFVNITNNTVYSGATTTSLTITGATLSMNGYLYRAVASNGSGSTNSTNGTLTVTALPANPTLLLKTPSALTVADGTNVSATFNAGSGGTGCADDFRYTTNGGVSYLPYTPGTNISTTGLAATGGYVFIEGRRANCSSTCQNSYVVLASWLVSPLPTGATTLLAGDIAFSGYIGGNSIAADEFSFVLLRNMGPGTAINFTSTGWLSTNTFGTAEETVTWTVPAGGLAAGTEIRIAGTTATKSGGGTAGTVTGTALTLSVNGDQVLAYTGSSGSPTFISGIHMNVYSTSNGDPVTTSAASWDGTATGVNASALPTGLTTGTNAIWIGVSGDINSEFDNARFGNCNIAAVSGPISALRAALNNRLNWITSNGGDPASFTLPTGCNYLSTLCPTITVTNPATATGVAGTAFSETFTSAGGTPTVTYSTTSTLPTGLTLSSAGVLSGTPTQSGSFPIVVVATDGAGCTGTGSTYTLVISCPAIPTPTVTPGGPINFCTGGPPVVLTSSATSGNQWLYNGGPIGGANNQTYNVLSSGSYSVVQNSIYAGCSSAPSAAVVVTVTVTPATPTITPGGPTTFCAGGSVTLTSSAASGNQWYLGASPIGGATNQTYVATASGNYRVITTANGCPSNSSAATTVTVTPLPATPTITPGGPTTFCSGGSVVLTSSSASGNQWYVGGNPIGGATNQTYTATASGTYTVVVTASGCSSAPSAGTTVTVNTTPVATATPSAQTICSGGTITTIVLSSSVGGTTYSWTRDNTASVTGIAANGTTNISGSLTNNTTAPVTVTFTITPTANSCPGTAITATVIVNPIPTVVKPADQVVCNGQSTGAINFTGTIPGTTYSWTNSNTSIGLAGSGTGNIASFPAVNTGTTAQVATITVTPSFGTINQSQTFNYTGAMQTWTVPAGVTSITIDAYGASGGTGASGTGTGGAGGMGSRASGTLAVTPGQVLNIFVGGAGGVSTGGYNGGGTGGNTSSGGGGGASDIRYPGTTSGNRLIVASGGGGGGRGGCESTSTINGGAGGNGDMNGGNGTDAPTSGGNAGAGAGGISTGAGGAAGVGCGGFLGQPGQAGTAAGVGGNGGDGQACCCFSFNSIPAGGGGGGGYFGGGGGGGGSAGTAGCSGNDKGAGGGGAGGTSYTGGVTAGSTTSGVQTGNGLVVINYSIAGCTGTPQTSTITVNPTPTATATPTSQTVCSGPITTIAITGPVSGTTFNWTRDNTVGVTGIAASGSGNISGSLVNNTAAPLTVTFTITPTANGCPGTAITATVIVNPRPVATATPSSQTVCSGPITTINLTSTVTGTTYSWTRDNTVNVTGIAASGLGSSISGTLINNTTVSQTVTFTITPTSPNSCGGTPITATVTVSAVPTITCPANITVPNDANQCGAVVTYSPTSTGIPAPTFTYTLTGATTGTGSGNGSGTLFNIGTTTVNITANNSCGSANCSFTVTVNDTQNPTITCPAPVFVSCSSAVPAVNTASVTATDNCPGVVVTHRGDVISGQTCTNRYTITRTYRATDASGNFVECTQIITVNDQTPPALTCPAPVTVSCASAVPPVNVLAVTGVSDNCGGPITVSHISDVISAQTCANRYTITRTYRATDACGNFAECTQIITVNDQTPPVLTCPAPITVSCASAVPAPNTALVTGVSDNCSGTVTVTHVGDVISAQTCANRYTITRTYRATDVCGNFAECTQIITVNDQTPPVLTCPAPVTVSCASAVPAPNIAAVTGVSDNCGGTVTVTHIGDVISAQTCANRYTITRTYRATDVCGNFAECTQIITVNDQTAPVITCPAPVTVSCASAVPAPNIASVTATDNCGGGVTITHVSDVISAQTCANRYTITRTYRATDVCGNFAQCTQIITVNDQTAPVITCPANITVTTPFGSCTAVVSFAATATDNCGGTITYSYSHTSGSAFPIGVTTVTATATDVCGNSASCTFTITVNDGQLPVITAQPVNRTVCAGTTATFSVTAVTAPTTGGPLSYQWEMWNGSSWVDVAGATSATLTLNNVTHAMNDNSYRVRVIGRCTTVISNFATLRVNPLPIISITASPLTQLIPGQTTTLTAVTNQPGGTYVWLLNGQPTGATGPTLGGLTIDNIGAYSVRYTDPNGCISTSAVIDISALQTDLMWVYPNPNFGQFQVRVYSTGNTPFTVNVYDSKGARVFTRTATPAQPYTSIPIDLGMKAMGMYIVELRDNTGRRLGSKQVMVHIR